MEPEDLVDSRTDGAVWSHQRSTFAWKGFVEVDLDPGQDAHALSIFLSTQPAGGLP